MSYILELDNIIKEFPGVRALDGVSMKVKKGEVHSVCGENGAGKSTLMNIIGGVYPHASYEGEIKYDGEVAAFKSIRDSQKKGIAFIHQELALSPYLSVYENIFLGNERKKNIYSIDWNETIKEAKKLLERVDLRISPEVKVEDISVGNQQMVELAKALSKNAKLIIFDEPTSALTEKESEKLLSIILKLKEEGITSIIITHKLDEVLAVSDTVSIIRDGKSVSEYSNQDRTLTEDTIIRDMVNRSVSQRYPKKDHTVGKEKFRIESLSVCHPEEKNKQILKDISFYAKEGEIVGISGLMGAGRTEMGLSIFGNAYGGTNFSAKIFLDGEEITLENPKDAINKGVFYMTEDRKGRGLILDDEIKKNISLASLDKITFGGILSENEEVVQAESYRKQVNIVTSDVSKPVVKLSGGNQQKVVLAKALASTPEVLIIDEPTRGIDVGAKYEVYTILVELAKSGKAIVIISSELVEILGMCDRIYVMSNGELSDSLDIKEATQEKIMKLSVK